MEEIDILDFIRYYVSKWFIVAILLVLVLIGGNIYTRKFRTPMYKSDTTIILVSEKTSELGKDSGYTQSDLNFNKNLVTTYSNIVKSKKVLNQVKEDLRLESTYTELYGKVTVSSVDDTEIIKITVTDSDPVRAMMIANSIVPIFSNEVERIYGIENVSVLDSALVASDPYNVNAMKENVIFALAGLLLGSMIIFVIYYFDSSVKSVEMIEDKLGLTVLGMVPKMEKRG